MISFWFQLSLLQTHLTFGKEFTEAVEMKQVGEYDATTILIVTGKKSNRTIKLWVECVLL